MSEVQSRPSASRGRGSARGGRGGFSSRGRGSRAHASNGEKADTSQASAQEEGEIGQLKKEYSSQVSIIKEMFPDWTDEDIVFALRETDGDLELTVERITDGTISQWGEVSKVKKDRSRSKIKETSPPLDESSNQVRPTRGGRGGRSRTNERGRGGRGRGALNAPINESRKEATGVSIPTSESNAWNSSASGDASAWDSKPFSNNFDSSKISEDNWGSTAKQSSTTKPPTTIPSDGVQKSWATLFAPAPVAKKVLIPVAEIPAHSVKPEEPCESVTAEPMESLPKPAPVETLATTTAAEPGPLETAEANICPSKDALTMDNLEQVPDSSAPVPTVTAASTAASSWDPRRGTHGSTPYSALQQQQNIGISSTGSGFHSSTNKLNNTSARAQNYQRRIFDQEEAVRMPGNREVDRTAVQFGAFSLIGNEEDDVDGDREEAETRAQPPQHSPVAPRAALPPAHQQSSLPETLPTPKQPPVLPATNFSAAVPGLSSPALLNNIPASSQPMPPLNGQYSHYGRYAQSGAPDKQYDSYTQQTHAQSPSPFEGYPSQQAQTQPPAGHTGAFSSTHQDYPSYYTADPQQRNAYNNYYQQQYASQHQAAQSQDGPGSQQGSYNGYNNPPGESSQFPQNISHQAQSRYVTAGDGQNSGHSTPNPVTQAPQTSVVAQAGQPQAGQQPQIQGTYPYAHPYYSSPYYTAYMNQYPGYGAGNYPGGPYTAKVGIHQQYQGYSISPGAPYEHSASPGAAAFGVSSLHSRDSALGGLSEYARVGSAQSSQNPQALAASAAFSASHDTFGRASYQGQAQQHYSSQQAGQPSGDDLKSFSDTKAGNGQNSSLHSARPGSATNTAPLPPPQSQQASYGSYPAHIQQPAHGIHGNQTTSQYGGLGTAVSQHQTGQGHQNSQYGAYQGFGGGNYYGNSQQQQRGGWGGNYGH
ncbi:BgTH12-02934 [Blumeria graminis f. sp. triticale]|uniref:RNA polymerase II degradation factor 1 n=3 Tax=Blumeria graminis TaxID=34373 RepID=A0A061HEH8_BLUGR|nr:hypothetical protein BGT96224_142 [Blumeria graminis f. sp. tritici 96224]CAD6503267.1 BgTH12-02934 [Blumeria graminis f. sp. triticale]VDB89268.1 Bgt-142 [Blumeria graminis f. sp. tritici]